MELPDQDRIARQRRVGMGLLLVVGAILALTLLWPWRRRDASLQGRTTDGPEIALDPAQASRFVRLSIDCVDRPFPNKPGLILDGADTLRLPQDLTPAFYGCFDWHSAVHGHWAMVRVLSRWPGLPEDRAMRAKLDAHLTPDNLLRELAYLQADRNKTFERPYGWGWLLRLSAELHGWNDPDARRWEAAVRPVAELISARTIDYLPRLSAPIRAGTHDNTAFAMVHMLDYARTVGDTRLEQTLVSSARELYGKDQDCPLAYEPSGEDFISPCLVEADLMRRVLDQASFRTWLNSFLPPVGSTRLAPLLKPVEVRDRRDPRIGHLIGLGFQRAWSLRGIAASLPPNDARVDLYRKLARVHAHSALQQMFDSGYGGEHWLASFAIYLTTGVGLDR